MAMAGARFAESLLKAAQGTKGVIEPTFVESPLYKDRGCDFFASRVELGPNGVERIHEVGKVSPYEEKLLEAVSPSAGGTKGSKLTNGFVQCVTDLAKNIKKGVEFVKANP